MSEQAKEIQQIIRQKVSEYKPRIWSWPHDSFIHYPWSYAIHTASVRAWNEEERKTECCEFLLAWSTEENIEKALAENETEYQERTSLMKLRIREILASHYRIGKSSNVAPTRWVCSCKKEFLSMREHDKHQIDEQVKGVIAFIDFHGSKTK